MLIMKRVGELGVGMILTTLILLMFQEAELGEIWRHLGIRAISGKEVLGSKAQQSFVIFRNVFFFFFFSLPFVSTLLPA